MKALLSFKSKWTPFLSICSTLIFLLFTDNLVAQVRPWMPPSELEIAAKGTGRTTGHIVTLMAVNNSDKPHQLEVGNFLIPSNGRDQSYVVPGLQNIEVPPGATVATDLYGYCADVSRPPVPAGEATPPPSTWLVPVNTPKPNGPPSFIVSSSHVQIVESKPGQTYIENVPVGYVNLKPNQAIIVNPDKNPEQAATFLLDAINRITFTYDELQPEGVINTPFSNNRDREREAVIQQTFWLYSSALSGNNYSKEQFSEQLANQYESSTGQPIASATPAQKEKYDAGVDDFWDSFNLVGVEAKVINALISKNKLDDSIMKFSNLNPPDSNLMNDPTNIRGLNDEPTNEETIKFLEEVLIFRRKARTNATSPDTQKELDREIANLERRIANTKKAVNNDQTSSSKSEDEESLNGNSTPEGQPKSATIEEELRKCECGDFTMKLRIKRPDGTYDRYFDVEYINEWENRITSVDASGAKIQMGEEIEFELSDIDFECSCEQTAPCDTYSPRRIYSSEPHKNAVKGSSKIHIRDETFETVKNNADNTKVTAKPKFTEEECLEMDVRRQYGFMIEQVCKTSTCETTNCNVYIFIRL